MKYLRGSFSVGGSTQKYRDGWDQVFGKKVEDPENNLDHECDQTCEQPKEARMKLVALQAICGDCTIEGPIFLYDDVPIAICVDCAVNRRISNRLVQLEALITK